MAARALVILAALLAGGCQADLPEPRALTRGFEPAAGVQAPYDDGKRQLAAGRYDLAIERFRQALASDRGSLEALNGLAISHVRLGRFEVARAFLERALEIDPFDAPTLNNYGRALIEQGRLREAEPLLQLALRHASQAERTIIAENLASMHPSQPRPVIAALEADPIAPPSEGRLIRLAASRYRLETAGLPSLRAPAGAAHASVARAAALRHPARPIQTPGLPAIAALRAGVASGVAGGVDDLRMARFSAIDRAAPAIEKGAADPRPGASGDAISSVSRAGRVGAPVLMHGEPK